MSADLLAVLARATLAASAAIIVVLLLRRPLRAAFGAQIAYAFWLLVPIATLAAFLPARRIFVSATTAAESAPAIATASPTEHITTPIAAALPAFDATPLILFIWLTGAVLGVLLIWRGQRAFLRNADAAGPAVVGFLRPRIVLPRDFDQRYTPAERELVLAHERAHIETLDAQINAFAALARCLNWFNPLFHIAHAALRVDQELACDARVMARHANAKRVYAEAMLKTQLAAQPIPLGCQWPPIGAQPLKERIAMLARPRPTSIRIALGAAACAALTLTVATFAWAAQEPRVSHVTLRETGGSAAERALGRQLIEALNAGQMTEARDLVNAGADVNYYLPGDGTPLVIAARFGSRDMVEFLLAEGADVNQAAPGDGNALIMASAFGHLDLVTLLIERGAQVDGVVHGDETPLINAARMGRLDVARYLIAQGADVNLAVIAPTIDGSERRSPLSEARRRGHREIVDLLRDHGAAS